MIEPDIDAYGKLARASSLADYVELLALSGKRCTRPQLSDLVADRWNLKKTQMVYVGEGDDEDADSYADQAFSVIDERIDLLGDRYPFEMIGPRLRIRSRQGLPLDSPYISLLCITISHAFGVAPAQQPELVFERLLGRALSGQGLLVAELGGLVRAAGNDFAAGVQAAGDDLKIPASAEGVPRRMYANDMGVDLIGHLHWQDSRIGRWTFIGQATCASSDEWKAKIQEPQPAPWAKLLKEHVPPLPFLGVPHHVEKNTLLLLVSENTRLVVDRIRLAMMLDAVTEPERAIIDAVIDADVQTVAV
jgi:hypothetical protein